jgi:hypothetical protein
LIADEFVRAIALLAVAGIVRIAWVTSYGAASNGRWLNVLWQGLLICGGIALFAASIVGTPSCESVSDPVYGGCDVYAENGFDPTFEQRAARFTIVMTVLYLPVALAALDARPKCPNPEAPVRRKRWQFWRS